MKYSNNITLVEHLVRGKNGAYNFLIDTYNKQLCTYAYTLVNDAQLAEDIVQDVYIKIWEKRKNLKPEYSLKHYLYKAVYNRFINLYRADKKFMILEEKHIEFLNNILYEDSNEDIIERMIQKVKLSIQSLPPKCQQIFLLSKYEGLTNIEISEYLNISIKTVEAHMGKAFNYLRKHCDIDKGMFFILFGKSPIRLERAY